MVVLLWYLHSRKGGLSPWAVHVPAADEPTPPCGRPRAPVSRRGPSGLACYEVLLPLPRRRASDDWCCSRFWEAPFWKRALPPPPPRPGALNPQQWTSNSYRTARKGPSSVRGGWACRAAACCGAPSPPRIGALGGSEGGVVGEWKGKLRRRRAGQATPNPPSCALPLTVPQPVACVLLPSRRLGPLRPRPPLASLCTRPRGSRVAAGGAVRLRKRGRFFP
mmetsp:Transcript_1861/g.6423  ORF Transcript_1861/g.6423 Transcript_1861/m.6423 type:complete len:221 (+) Transcript_1861:3-665(+)